MSDRIAVMHDGRVEQIGTPREIYEHPATAFVADFIGSLNALDVTVDELVGGYALTRPSERDRIVAPVGWGIHPGDALRIAVRPEHVHIALANSSSVDDGSRLDGTLADVVYLGMYIQFHVDTAVGRVVSHRLAGESLPQLAPGDRVEVSWDADSASVLEGSPAIPEPVGV